MANLDPGSGGPGTVPPPGGGVPPPATPGGHWTTPDYTALIQGDPTYQATIANINAGVTSAGLTRASAVKQALIRFGAVPKGWQSGYGDITPDAIAAAAANPYSTTAQLLLAKQHGSADLAAVLAGRGMLSSGALTGGEQMVQNTYDKNLTGETEGVLGTIGGAEGTYAGVEQQAGGQRIGALTAAGTSVQAANPPTWVPDPVAPTPPAPFTPLAPLNWGGRQFSNKGQFITYLGGPKAYARWAAAHPNAAARWS